MNLTTGPAHVLSWFASGRIQEKQFSGNPVFVHWTPSPANLCRYLPAVDYYDQRQQVKPTRKRPSNGNGTIAALQGFQATDWTPLKTENGHGFGLALNMTDSKWGEWEIG
ncbi:hypothetical protein SCARD494_04728 [Seiridium cardinale]